MTKLESWITRNIQDIETDDMGYPVLSENQAIDVAMILKDSDIDFMYSDVLNKVGDFSLFEDLLIDFALQPTIKNCMELAKYTKAIMIEAAKHVMDQEREFIASEQEAYGKAYAEMARAAYLIELQEMDV